MNIKQTIGRAGLFLKKNKTNISYFASIGLLVCGTVLLVKKSFEMEGKLDEAEIKVIQKRRQINPELTEADIPKNDKEIRTEQVKAVVKNYILPVALYTAGTALNIYTFRSQKKTIAGLGLALNGMTAAYTGLLNKIRKELGEDAYNHFKYGTERKEYLTRAEDGSIMTEVKEKMPDHFDTTPFVWEFAQDNSSVWDRYNPANNLAKWVELDERLGLRLQAKSYITNLEIVDSFGLFPRNAKEEAMWKIFAITGYRLPFKDERDKAYDESGINLPMLGEYSLGSKEFLKANEGNPFERSHRKTYPIQLGGTYLFNDPRLWDNMPLNSITVRRYKHA